MDAWERLMVLEAFLLVHEQHTKQKRRVAIVGQIGHMEVALVFD